jgi:hypothetical protein
LKFLIIFFNFPIFQKYSLSNLYSFLGRYEAKQPTPSDTRLWNVHDSLWFHSLCIFSLFSLEASYFSLHFIISTFFIHITQLNKEFSYLFYIISIDQTNIIMLSLLCLISNFAFTIKNFWKYIMIYMLIYTKLLALILLIMSCAINNFMPHTVVARFSKKLVIINSKFLKHTLKENFTRVQIAQYVFCYQNTAKSMTSKQVWRNCTSCGIIDIYWFVYIGTVNLISSRDNGHRWLIKKINKSRKICVDQITQAEEIGTKLI